MSPAAHTPGAEVSSAAPQRTPPVSPSSSPAARASMTSGTAPVPMTTASASTTRPEAQTTRSIRSAPSKRSSGSPQTSSTPLLCSRSAKNRPAVAPKPVSSGADSTITIVQRLPSAVSVAATSQAM